MASNQQSMRGGRRGNGLPPHPPDGGRSVLVTGGGGYIGCVLVPRLLDRGYGVRVVDALWWGEGPLAGFRDRIELVEADGPEMPDAGPAGIRGVTHLPGPS